MNTHPEDAIYSIIGKVIRRLRTQAHMSQQDLALQLGVSRASIVNIEAGRQRSPIHTLYAIAMIFHVPVHILLQEIPSQEDQMQLRLENTYLRSQLEKIRSILSDAENEKS